MMSDEMTDEWRELEPENTEDDEVNIKLQNDGMNTVSEWHDTEYTEVYTHHAATYTRHFTMNWINTR